MNSHRMRLLSGSLSCVAAALLVGCSQEAARVAPAPISSPAATIRAARENPPESFPSDPRTLAKIKEAFAKTPNRPLPKNADISQSFRNPKTRTDFWRRVFVDGFRAHKTGDAAQTDPAEKFLEGYCLRIGDSPAAPPTDELRKQGEQLYEANVRDPHVTLALAAVLFDSQKEGSFRLPDVRTSLEEAFQGDKKHSPWLTARFHRLKASVIRLEEGEGAGTARRAQMEFMIDDLLRAAADPALTNIQRRMLVYLLRAWAEEFPAGQFRLVLTMKLDSAKQVDPWVRELVLARVYTSTARPTLGGSGDFGGLAIHWEHARRHALKAWELRPELPEAAGELLNITRARQGAAGEEARFWFDEAVQAEFNYLPAYYDLAWALRPRWGGSHEKMMAFGDECLQTERFDTDVPLMFHKIAGDFVDEGSDWATVLQTTGFYERYRFLLENLARVAQDDAARNRHRSRLAAVCYLAGKKDEARKILSELKGAASAEDFEAFKLSLDEVRLDLGSQ